MSVESTVDGTRNVICREVGNDRTSVSEIAALSDVNSPLLSMVIADDTVGDMKMKVVSGATEDDILISAVGRENIRKQLKENFS